MHIPTELLSVFKAIHQNGSYTKASQYLGLTQPAISQKMAKLEQYLQASLFIKSKQGLTLTSSGEKLLGFANQQLQMEEDFLNQFNQYQDSPAGIIRVAGFSSITRSVLIPTLAPIMKDHSKCQIEFSSHEVVDLMDILKRSQADIIITDYKPHVAGIESHLIGKEEYVVIESNVYGSIPDIYLDHGPHDNATESYFDFQDKVQSYRRGFMGDVYGIIEGVELGLGKAVMSKHLVKDIKNIKIKRYPKRYYRELYVSFMKQSYYSPLHIYVCTELKGNSRNFL